MRKYLFESLWNGPLTETAPSIEDEARAHDPPLASDELAVIGKAWQQAGFSMRKLQKIVLATLEARDSYAQRH